MPAASHDLLRRLMREIYALKMHDFLWYNTFQRIHAIGLSKKTPISNKYALVMGEKMENEKIYQMRFDKVYGCLVQKAERKGRTKG